MCSSLWKVLLLIPSTFSLTLQRDDNNLHSDNQADSGLDYKWISNWPSLKSRKLGSVSAVTFNFNNSIVIFQRGNHVWNAQSFNTTNHFMGIENGPIQENTVVVINRATGEIEEEWGINMFYMPHGLLIDKNNNAWITDVAMHQVFKFNLNKSREIPDLILGKVFMPGNDELSFCKPTSVAVLDNGDFFVADGYCNARIIKYSANGERILSWGKNSFKGKVNGFAPNMYFAVPHALTVVKELGLLCVADRENGRIQCFYDNNGTFHSEYNSSVIGERIFSVAYVPIRGGLLYVINGPQLLNTHEISGYIVDMKSSAVIGKFVPNNVGHMFMNPHDIAVKDDGSEIYVAELNPTVVHKFTLIMENIVEAAVIDTKTEIKMAPPKIDVKPRNAWIIAVISAILVILSLIAISWSTKKTPNRWKSMFKKSNENCDEVEVMLS